jgi:carbamoyl-phosphate synthase large subunit
MTFPLLLSIGCALLAAALAWRTVRLFRIRRGVLAALTSDEPATRVAAVQEAGELGLATTAPALLRTVRAEQDPAVLAAVLRVVAGHQWEPASTGRVVELRLWAKAYAEAHPELRRAPSGAPLQPGVAGVVPPPSLLGSAPTRRRSTDTSEFDRSDESAEWVPEPSGDPDPLHPVRVLVTGVGGPAGVAVLRALRHRGHYVIGVDADPGAVGLQLADEDHLVPRHDDPTYLTTLLHVATRAEAQALICTVAEELPALAAGRQHLAEAGVRTLLPGRDAAMRCIDKWRFSELMTEAGLPAPATGLGSAVGVPRPWVVKPRFGRGSRDVTVVRTIRTLNTALRRTPEPIVQTLLVGREFTVDALVDPSGTVLAALPRWRLETKAGISTKGETFNDPAVSDLATLVLKAVGLAGPANVQGFVSADGEVSVHEANPRFSGGLPLTLAAGADLVEEYLRGIMGRPMRADRLVARPGVRMLRYYAEVFTA